MAYTTAKLQPCGAYRNLTINIDASSTYYVRRPRFASRESAQFFKLLLLLLFNTGKKLQFPGTGRTGEP